ncbi:TlpA family protein disulfide reductase [Chloroflexota bacterium]
MSIYLISSPYITGGCSENPGIDTTSDSPTVAPWKDHLAPDFALRTLDGEIVRLSELRGQPVLINFWATWCPSCRMEMPHLQAAFEELAGEVYIVAINVGESEEKVRRYVEDNGLSFTVLTDPDKQVGDRYNIRYYPTTFLVDNEGVIREIRIGAFPNEASIIQLLDQIAPE